MYTQYFQQPNHWAQARECFLQTNVQAIDVKHLAEYEHVYRYRCRVAIQLYKNWRDDYEKETDVIALLYGRIEGEMLRAQAVHAIELYWAIRLDFKVLFDRYVERITAQKSYKEIA